MTNASATKAMRNSAFSTLICATQSFLALQFLTLWHEVTSVFYGIGTIISIATVGFMFRRVLLYCPPPQTLEHFDRHDAFDQSRLLKAGRCLLLVAGGYASFAVFLSDWITLLALIAPFLIFIHWAKLTLQPVQLVATWSAIVAGSVLAILFSRGEIIPTTLPIGCWLFWTCTTISWMRLLGHTRSEQLKHPQALASR